MFVGRTSEGQAILLSVRSKRSVVLVAPTGYGKSTLLAEVAPGFEDKGAVLRIAKVGPFSTFIDDLFLEIRKARIPVAGVTYSSDPREDSKCWKKAAGESVASRTRSLLKALRQYAALGTERACIAVDDASELSSSMVPWFLGFDGVCVLVLATYSASLNKKPLQRLWARFDRVDLPPLTRAESVELLEERVTRYGIVAENMEAYKKRVLSLSNGIPAEIDRLVRFVSVSNIVRNRDVGTSFAQDVAQRQERGIALAPVLLVMGGGFMVTKYLGLARGEMDLYFVGGIGIALFMVLGPWMRKAVMSGA